jgi:hypothetical protein
MAYEGAVDHGRDHNYEYDLGSQGDIAHGTDPCVILEEDIEVLQQEIDILEAGMRTAPGGQRAALAKELAAYRTELDSRKRELRQCRGMPA